MLNVEGFLINIRKPGRRGVLLYIYQHINTYINNNPLPPSLKEFRMLRKNFNRCSTDSTDKKGAIK